MVTVQMISGYTIAILAADDDFSWGRLLFFAAIVLMGLLGKLSEWLRERAAGGAQKKGPVIDDEGYLVLDPTADAGSPPPAPRESMPRPVARARPDAKPAADPSTPRRSLRRAAQPAPPFVAREPQRTDLPPQPPVRTEPPPVRPSRSESLGPTQPARPSARSTSTAGGRKRKDAKTLRRRSAPPAGAERPPAAPTRLEDHHLVSSIKAAPQDRPAVGSELLSDVRELSLDELRRAILLSEVIGPPLALREPSESW